VNVHCAGTRRTLLAALAMPMLLPRLLAFHQINTQISSLRACLKKQKTTYYWFAEKITYVISGCDRYRMCAVFFTPTVHSSDCPPKGPLVLFHEDWLTCSISFHSILTYFYCWSIFKVSFPYLREVHQMRHKQVLWWVWACVCSNTQCFTIAGKGWQKRKKWQW
jgi:hypothetical protein